MAFTKPEDWSETAASNTEMNGISLDENVMRPPAVNNQMREHMAQIAKWLGDDTVASATTADLGSVNGRYVAITGTTTITGFGTIKAGTVKYLKFAGILTLTHNATSLILPTGASITTAAGDTAIVVSEGSGNWRCIAYQRASGAALAGSSAASTTEVLTGTDTAKAVTPDALAALWEKGSDEAAAGTVSFGEGGYFHITGTTTITDIDFDTAKDGRAVDVVFDAALTLTHNGTTLQLPGGVNILTAAGDRARFVQDNSDNVICLWYVRAGSPPSVGPHVIIEDQKAQNTNGGTFTSGADRTRDLNAEVYDPYGLCSLSSNQFTLPAGTWIIDWSASAALVDAHQSFLYNVTDTAEVKRGSSEYAAAANQGANRSHGTASVTITGSKAFEIRHRCTATRANDGFGIRSNFGTEVYTAVKIWKVS